MPSGERRFGVALEKSRHYSYVCDVVCVEVTPPRLSEDIGEFGQQHLFGFCAHDLLDDFSVLEHQHCWDRQNLVLVGRLRVGLNVQLGHRNLVPIFVGDLVENGAPPPAGAAPFSPENNDDWPF